MIPEGKVVGSPLSLTFPSGLTMAGTISELTSSSVTVTYSTDPYTGAAGPISYQFSLPFNAQVVIS